MRSHRLAVAAEFLGTLTLVCVVVGSGIMGTNLSDDAGVALIINQIATVLALGLLIAAFMPISGSHFNPVVTVVMWLRREITALNAFAYVAAQVLGAMAGSVLANLMFDLPAVTMSTHVRASVGLAIGEIIATAGLLVVILVSVQRGLSYRIPVLVPLWIGSAYFFTSSTSFANPAVTIGRAFTDTFAGIAPQSVVVFILCQFAGALLGVAVSTMFNTDERPVND